MILPGGRDLERPSRLCAEAEASRDTFSALDGGVLSFSYLSVATSASGQTLQGKV
jgi:hypothetical protein